MGSQAAEVQAPPPPEVGHVQPEMDDERRFHRFMDGDPDSRYGVEDGNSGDS